MLRPYATGDFCFWQCPCVLPPLPTASLLHTVWARGSVSAAGETDWCPQKDWKWGQGSLDHEQLLSELAQQLEREIKSKLKMASFFTKIISRQMGHFFNSWAVHTLMCALLQTRTEFHVWCNGMSLLVSQECKLICFDGKTTITLGTKLNREKKIRLLS